MIRRLVVGGTALALVASGCSRERISEPTPGPDLTACAVEPDAPLVFLDRAGTPTGFSFELLSDLVERARGTLRLDRVSAARVVFRLLDRDCDLIMSTVTDRPEDLESIELSEPYVDDNFVVVARKADVTVFPSVASLAGQTIGTVGGSDAEVWLRANPPAGSTVEPFPSDGDLFAALRKGRVAAGFVRRVSAGYRATRDDAIVLTEVVDTGFSIGFGLRPGDDATRQLIEAGLTEMIDDGSFAELRQRWFGDQTEN